MLDGYRWIPVNSTAAVLVANRTGAPHLKQPGQA